MAREPSASFTKGYSDKSTSSREHAFWRFGTGDHKTLWETPRERGFDVRKRLIEWCEKHYSAILYNMAPAPPDQGTFWLSSELP